MSSTRKLAVGFAVLLALLSVFWAYEATVMAKFADDNAREVDRKKTELAAMERGEPSTSTLGQGNGRSSYMDMLRASTSRPQDLEEDRADVRNAWIESVGGLGLAIALGAFAVVAGRKEQPKLVATLARVPAMTIVSGSLAVFALLVCVTFAREAARHSSDLSHQEERLVKLKGELESFGFDANGNVDPKKRMDFEMLMSQAKYLPGSVKQTRENLQLEGAIAGGSLLAAIGLGVLAVRSARKRATAPA